jgi:DUF4097 and DUF4098 domain-containing protein YvlB
MNATKWLALAVLAPGLLFAQGKVTRQGSDWTEESTGTLSGCQRLHVETPGGNVEVRGGASPDVAYRAVRRVRARSEEEGRRKLAAVPVRAKRAGDLCELSLEEQRNGSVGVDYFVTAPKSLRKAQMETAGGNILVENIDGETIASTAGGDIHADRVGATVGGATKVETAGGEVVLGQIRGKLTAESAGGNITLREGLGEAMLETVGGNITVESCARTVRAESSGGDVSIKHCGGDVRLETAGGAIRLGTIDGIVVAETAGGAIEVESARAVVRAGTASGPIRLRSIAGPVRAETAEGNISATVIANRASWAASLLETSNGDVIVYLPANLAVTIKATIDMAASRQSIRSDFPLVFRDLRELPGMRELSGEAQVNGGGPQLVIRTVSGKIEIVKVNK